MNARAQKQSSSTGLTVGAGGTSGDGGGSAESGSAGVVRLGTLGKFSEGAGGTAGDGGGSTASGSVGVVTLGNFAKGDGSAGIGQATTAGVVDGEKMEAAPAPAPAVGGSTGDKERSSVGVVRLGNFAEGNIETGSVPTGETKGIVAVGQGSDNNNNTAAGVADKTRVVSPARGVKMEKGGGTEKRIRKGRVEHKLRKSQRHRRKAHHYLMSLTYRGLQPGMDYHIRVAGVSSVGQVHIIQTKVCERRTYTERGLGYACIGCCSFPSEHLWCVTCAV